LPLSCCPAAVRWLVVAIFVDTVENKARRPATHVGKKRFIVVPTFAHSDPGATVSFVGVIVRIVAARMHSDPANVLARALTALVVIFPSLAMFGVRYPVKVCS
jgi:hypothetical protein